MAERYWVHDSVVDDQPDVGMPFGLSTVGIVDEERGGVLLYCHRDEAPDILDRLLGQQTEIVTRLQQELAEAYGNDTQEWNLWRAAEIDDEIRKLEGLQARLKRAFKDDEIDGGWKAALTHPLYLKAEARIASLNDELKGLI